MTMAKTQAPAEAIIDVRELSKRFGDVQAVDRISFSVPAGSTTAFLGPNGAGKSTTINCLCTFVEPDEGTAQIAGARLGRDDERIRQAIGVVFQNGVLDPVLSVRRNLSIRGRLYGIRDRELTRAIERVSEACRIGDLLQRRYGELSGGQRRRCDIARALLSVPRILFLDEPCTGLDPQTRQSIWDTIQALKAEHNMSIFMTTHYMEEVQYADHVLVIDHGRIVEQGTPDQLRQRYASDRLKLYATRPRDLLTQLEPFGYPCRVLEDQLVVDIPDTLAARPLIERVGERLEGFEVITGSMDEVFIRITGRELRE